MAYIPESHKKYGMLPLCQENGGEVFEYPPDTSEIDSLLELYEINIEPYGYESYEQYYDFLDTLINEFKKLNPKLERKLKRYKKIVLEENVKEQWSICRYIGESTDSAMGLTKGHCYYWPASYKRPFFHGVIDDEEFTGYQYNTKRENWEILEDPTGMAKKAIEKSVGEDFEVTPEILEQIEKTTRTIGTPDDARIQLLEKENDKK